MSDGAPRSNARPLRRRIPGLARLGRAVQRHQVEDLAACARALTALVGKVPEVDPLPGGAGQVPRAVLTARLLQDSAPVPWPHALMRQLDPDDPAFLPPLGLHPVLQARDRTLLGLPDDPRVAWVDPFGWMGVGDGPSVAVWFGDGRHAWPVGPHPDERGAAADPPWTVSQRRSRPDLGVVTTCQRGPLTLTLTTFPIRLDGRIAWVLHAALALDGPAPRPVRLAFALRPSGFEGASPIFHLERSEEGLWTADGEPLLALASPGSEVIQAVHGEADPWLRLTGQRRGGPHRRPGALSLRCPAGQASAAELYRDTCTPGEPLTRLAVFAPPAGVAPQLVRTTGHTLWVGAEADRAGLLRAGAELTLAAHQEVLEACRARLLAAPTDIGLGGLLGAVALARMGFVRRAGDRIAAGLARVRRDGSLPDAEGPETAAVLAWAASEHLRWTDARNLAKATRKGWERLVERLVDQADEPGGFALFGSQGSARWTAIWRAAGLVGSAHALRALFREEAGNSLTRWGLAGARACELLDDRLGDGPWQSAHERAPDGSSAAMLTAAWLGVLPLDHRGVATTVAFLGDHCTHNGGVLLRGGAHVAATSLLTAVRERLDPGSDQLGRIAALASPTGALPTVRHATRGALGEGDDLLSAALFVLLAVERVQASKGELRVLPGLAAARDLPTPYGPVTLEDGVLRGQWRGPAPSVVGARVG